MADTIVLKVGGGILKDKDSFKRVVNVVSQNCKLNKKQIIVISALYGVTDFLISSINKCILDPAIVPQIISELQRMHFQYLSFISDAQVRKNAENELNEKISRLEKIFYGVAYLKEASPKSKDFIQSYGERLSPIVLEAFLLDSKIDSKFIDAEEAGIICHGAFENAMVNFEETQKNIDQRVMPILGEKVVLLPGYYGADHGGNVKTFGRGGTDYSAGFIANICDAKLEIWKDVTGFMSADPKTVADARFIELLSYDEAEELGLLGAKILHPKTIDPLRSKNLAAEVKSIFQPEKKGTIISSDKKKHELVVKSIAATKDLAIVTIHSTSMVSVPGFAALVFSKLAEKGVSVNLIVTSEASISFSTDTASLQKALTAMEEISKHYPSRITSNKDLAMIAVVGEGMQKTSGISGRVFNALGKERINIELISQGASEINISFVIKKTDMDKAIKAVHAEFFK